MRVLIQRVKEASVTIDGKVISLIHNGLLVFVGITDDDNRDDILWLTKKIANIRLFDDENGVMNIEDKIQSPFFTFSNSKQNTPNSNKGRNNTNKNKE